MTFIGAVFSVRRASVLRWGRVLAVGLGLASAAQAQVTVTSRQPARNALSAPRSTSVGIGFSQLISAATANNLSVHGSLLRGQRPGSVSGGGTSQLTFGPNQAFAAGEVVSVSLPSTLTGSSGAAVTRQVYQFTAATGGTGRGFFLDTTIVAPFTGSHQLLGDLDGDGDLDMVTHGGLFGCRIYLNDGAGRYQFKINVIAAQEPGGVALADVDRDGDLDLLISDARNSSVSICRNTGSGSFTDIVSGGLQSVAVGAHPVGIATGDIDGDGDLDFATANAEGNSATAYRNGTSSGAAGFYSAPVTVAMGAGPTSVVLADIDNDGDLDLVTANAGTAASPAGEVRVRLNNGTGSFELSGVLVLAVGQVPTELLAADIDGDGDLDLLTADAGGASVSIRLNNGLGGFAGRATIELPAGSTPSGLRAGDVDGDGDLDLVVAQGRGGRVFTYLNTGGSFAAQARPLRLSRNPAVAEVSTGVTLGDVDGDLDLDLLTTDDQGNVILSLNQASPPPLPAPVITALTPAAAPIGATITVSGTTLTDVEAVRFGGVLAPGFSLDTMGTALAVKVPPGAVSGPVTVETFEAGTAASPVPFTVTIPVPVLLTGLTPPRNAVSVARNSAINASFSQAITPVSAAGLRVFGSQRQGRVAGTLAGGGTATLTLTPAQPFAPGELVSVSMPASLRDAAGNPVAAQVVQFTAATGGSGQLNFGPGPSLGQYSAAATIVGDVDGDGDLDLLTAKSGVAPTVQLYLNDGRGSFGTAQDVTTGQNYCQELKLADVDADGDLDLLVAADRTVIVLRNNGQGAFAPYTTFTADSAPQQILTADLDADGDLDLLLGTQGSAVVWLNSGSGTFSPGDFLPLGLPFTNTVALGDVDADGDLDLVLGGRYNGLYQQPAVAIGYNDGNGRFSAAQTLLFNKIPTQVALADLDADGDLDLLVRYEAGYVGEGNFIRLNNGAGSFATTGGNLPLPGSGMVLADADADGDLDLLTHSHMALGDGKGSFSAILPLAETRPYSRIVATADLDGDLDLDLISNGSSQVLVRFNLPAPPPTITALLPGSGPVGSTILLTGTNFIGARAVALNGVPAPVYTVRSATELVVTVPAGASSSFITVTTPAGQATSKSRFEVTLPIAVVQVSPARNQASAPASTPLRATFAQPISAATASTVRVFAQQNSRTGTVSGGGTSQLTFTPAKPFGAGELISISLPARLAGSGSGNVRPEVYQFTTAVTGTGSGRFDSTGTANIAITPSTFNSLTAGDFNNDGKPDFVTFQGDIRLGAGNGTFNTGPKVSFYNSGNGYALALGDLNNDGKLDIATSYGQMLLNKGPATFTPQTGFTDKRHVGGQGLSLGDMDADGDLDLIIAISRADSLCIRFNDGTGRFPTYQLVAVDPGPISISVGDVDNDGDLDLVAVCGGGGYEVGSLSICLNNGQGLFTRGPRLATGVRMAKQAVLGDLDNDGDLDLATNNGFVGVNDGRGGFTLSQPNPIDEQLALGDVDSDGDLDLVITGFEAVVRLNNGQGQFSSGPALGLMRNAGQLLLRDLDGDDDLDLLVPALFDATVYVRLNQRIAQPAIISFAPASGLPSDAITLAGTDLIGITEVSFNGTPAPGFTINTVSELTVRIPAGATTGPVTVRNPAGSASSPQPFTVLLPVPVLGVSPAPNATAARNAAVTVRFGQAQPVHSAATLAVFSQMRGGLLAGSRQGAGTSSFTFAPIRPFQAGEQLSVSIPAYTEANQSRVRKRAYQFRAAVGGSGRGYFEAPTLVAADGESVLRMGDVSGDGNVDMVVLNRESIEIRRNNGAGGFPAVSTTIPINTDELRPDLVLGDVDNDGDLDIVVSVSGLKLLVLLNNGAGVFPQQRQLALSEEPTQLNLADMDADGDLDIIMTNKGRSACTVTVGFNNGTGVFSGLTNTYLGQGTNVILSNTVIGDIDGDGDLDLLVDSDASYLLRNDGNGQLAPPVAGAYAAGNSSTLDLVDIDNDGDLDVLSLQIPYTARNPSVVRISRNNGQGQFTLTQFNAGIDASPLTVGDLDADGDLDLLVLGDAGRPSEIWLNDGQGQFSASRPIDLGAEGFTPLLCDVDNDGDLDLLSDYYYAIGFSVRLNGAAPPPVVSSFAPAAGPVGTTVVLIGSGFQGATEVRFNGVAAPGFVVNSATQLTVKVPAGASTGAIAVTSPVATASSAMPFAVTVQLLATSLNPGPNAVSVPRNGPLRLTFSSPVTAASAATLRVFGNQVQGQRAGALTGGGTATLTFAPERAFAPGEQISVSLPATMQATDGKLLRPQVYQFRAATGGPGRGLFRGGSSLGVGWSGSNLVTGDIDNDGDLDLLLAATTQYSYDGNVSIARNDGQGRFQLAAGIEFSAFEHPKQLLLGDVDGNGALDVLWTFGSGISISLNKGNDTFYPAQKLYTSADKLALGDVDADGDLDLVVVTSYLDGRLSVVLNQGNGTFAAPAQHVTSLAAANVVLADVDNDGDLDALTANQTQGLRLYLNEGNGQFVAGPGLSAEGDIRQLLLEDLDADGFPDVVALSFDGVKNAGWLSVLRNSSRGGFEPAGPRLFSTTNSYIHHISLSDVDHDADLDLVVAYGSTNHVAVQVNDGRGNFQLTVPATVSYNPGTIALGDFDGDGDVDFAALQAATGGGALDIRFNDGQVVTRTTAGTPGLVLKIYPNPAQGQFTVAIPPELHSTTPATGLLRLYNSVGKLVLEQPLRLSASGEQTVHVASLPPGLYALRLLLKEREIVGKVILTE